VIVQTPEQQRRERGGKAVVNLFINGAGDPRAVAREVARHLKLQGVMI
jgi:hypothetical protein